jgi:hypothetical protein
MIPPKNDLAICFAHVAYQLGPQFAARNRGIRYLQATNREELQACVGQADVLVVAWPGAVYVNSSRLAHFRWLRSRTANDQPVCQLWTYRITP